MLKVVLLVVCIAIAMGSVIYFFFWNRILGYILSLLLRLALWTQDKTAIWVDFDSAHFSLIAGRLILRDIRYHSSNQTFRIVKCQISWRWWIRNVAEEEDLVDGHSDNVEGSSGGKLSPRCRLHVSMEGFEWFMYNRVPSFDNILATLLASNRGLSGGRMMSSELNNSYSVNHSLFVRDEKRPHSSFSRAGRRMLLAIKLPSFVDKLLLCLRHQLPDVNPKKLLPLSFDVSKGAISMGNHTTESLLMAQFARAYGSFGEATSRSKLDDHKQLLRFTFKEASISCVENPDFWTSSHDVGKGVGECFAQLNPPTSLRTATLTYSDFKRLWTRCRKAFRFYRTRGHRYAKEQKRKAKEKKLHEEISHVGADFSKLEYAIDRKLLEAPSLELLYYADVAGFAPTRPVANLDGEHDDGRHANGIELNDIGNGDLPPEWGVDVIVHGGAIHYGPWADRQRVQLQRVFFPQTFQDHEPTAILLPGDRRACTCLKLFFEFRGSTTVLLPFKEASKNWQWDGIVDVPRIRKQREAASIQVRLGDRSTVKYLVPMVATTKGYTAELDAFMDNISVTSSLNDIRLLEARSCSITSFLPSPLQWNIERSWDFDMILDRPTIYLIRDHINMLTDLGRDWSSGPPHDFNTFVPMTYNLKLILLDFELSLYANDHNIIDRPLDLTSNVLLSLKGGRLKNVTSFPANRFRPLFTEVTFYILSPDVALCLSLPRWNTHAVPAYSAKCLTSIGHIGLLRLDGSYTYHAEVRNDCIDQLKMNIEISSPSMKLFGWVIRHAMVLRENYFGTFTQYSTTREYLNKQENDFAVGDPLDLKYRPGKNNIFYFDLSLIVKNGTVALPAGIFGFERAPRNPPGDIDIGSCTVVAVPELQLLFRLHDFAMEMSLDVDPVALSIVDSCPDRLLLSHMFSPAQRQLTISGLQITANRLFGPQPHTSTYVCIWKISLGIVKASLDTLEAQILMAAGRSFGHGFVDPFNAPSADFTIPSERDATFLKVMIDKVDVSWKNDSTHIRLCLNDGLRFAFNNIAKAHYRKLTSMTISNIELQVLTSSINMQYWLEAGRVRSDISFELCSAPLDWQKDAKKQKSFLSAQDAETHRFSSLISPVWQRDSGSPRKWSNGLYLQNIRAPRVSSSPGRNRISQPTVVFPTRGRAPLYFTDSESDGGYLISEADRDERLAKSRPINPAIPSDRDEGSYSTSPLDESDESDNEGSGDSWSDYFEFRADEQADGQLSYMPFCRKFRLRAKQSGLDYQPLDKITKVPIIQSYMFSEDSSSSTSCKPRSPFSQKSSDIEQSNAEGKKYISVDIKDTRVFVTALCMSALKEVLEQGDTNGFSPELRLDELMLEQIPEQGEPSSSIYDVRVHSFKLCSVHEAADLLAVRPVEEPPKGDCHAFAVTKLEAQEVRLVGVTPSGGSSSDGPPPRYGRICVCRSVISIGSLYTSGIRTKPDIIDPSTAIEYDVNDFVAAVVNTRYHISCDASDLKLFRVAPEVVIGAVRALQAPAREVLTAQRNRAMKVRLRDKKLLCGILSRKTFMESNDLLSPVQPAFFVQSGRPQWLRGHNIWKYLFHLRHALSDMSREDYDVLKQELRTIPVAADIDNLLHDRLVSFALEDGPATLNIELVESLFQGNMKKRSNPIKRNDSRPVKSAGFQANSLTLTIDGDELSQSSVMIREIDLRADLLSRRMIFEVVSLSPYSSTIRSFSPTSTYVDYGSASVLLALDIESMQVTIFPSIIGFLQNAVHVWRILMSPVEDNIRSEDRPKPTAMSPLNDFLANRVVACDIRFVLNHMLVEAAAENVVFEVTSERCSSCSVFHVTRPLEGASVDISLNNTVGFRELAVKARTRSFVEKDMDTLASITVLGVITGLLFQNHTPDGSNLRGTIHATSLELNVPRSAIRLYKFMEQWRQDYLLGIETMLQSLFTEIRQTPERRAKQSSKKRFNVHINSSLSAVSVILQVMHGTWLAWTAYGVIGYLVDRPGTKNITRACGLQISSQVVRLTSTSTDWSSQRVPKIVLDLPSVSACGSFTMEHSAFVTSIGFLEVTIKPSHWDTLLSVQQKFGQDFNDLLLILGDAKGIRTSSSGRKSSVRKGGAPFHVTARFEGFRVGLEGHSFTQFLECMDIDATISTMTSPHWNVNLTDLALYLSPRNLAKHKLAEVDRSWLPALVSVNLHAVNHLSSQGAYRRLGIDVTKLHAVLQAHLMGDIGDFIDHLQAELMLRKEQRAVELQEFKEKATKVMEAFNLKPGRSSMVKQERFLDNSSITITVANFGAVFPLELERRQTAKPGSDKRVGTRALLMSIKSVRFETQRGESGEAFMEGFCFQFVSRFDPSNPDDFSARRHHTLNQMLYPEMTARMRTETLSARRIFASASINGFILDLDPSITLFVFSLVDAYRHGKQRVERLAVTIPRSVTETSSIAVQKASRKSALTSSIEASLQFMSGTVRMHCTSKDSSTFSSISPDWPGNTYQILDSDAEIFKLPEVSVSAEYRADVGQLGKSYKQGTRSPVLVLKSTLHSSRNALRPLVLSFVSGIVHNVEERMKQTSHLPPRSPSNIRHSLSSLTLEEPATNTSGFQDPTEPDLQLFISLRIDKSRLEFTCRPDVNVIAGVNWESGGFIFSTGPGAQGVSISASIEGLTIGLKHGFLSDDSAHIDARNLIFSINFSKSILSSGQFINSISMVVDTEFSGGLRFSRFQDILCFNAVWLDHIPVFKGDVADNSTSPSKLRAVSSLEQPPKQGFDTAIVIRVRRIALEADLGQSISTVTFDLQTALVRMRMTPVTSEVAISFARVDMRARGNLSGHLKMPDFVFRTVRRRQATVFEKQCLSRMLELNLTSGTLDIQIQSDWLWLLQYRAEPLEARIYDDWTVDSGSTGVKSRELHLFSSVSGSKVVAMMTIMAIPKLLMYGGKLRSSLESQREGASRESSAFRSTRLPKPDNALSEVANAMFRSARSKLKESESLSYVINQHMELQLSELVFVVLPRSQGDTELARFIGRDVMAQLDRIVHHVDQPAHRNLHLSLSYMSISQLIKQGFDSRLPGQEFDVLTASGRKFPGTENAIFSLPAMDMRMISDEGAEECARILPYDFLSNFVRREGQKGEDIHISFNIRLYSWLTVLRKTLTRELKRAQEVADWKTMNISPPNLTAPKFTSPDATTSPFLENDGTYSPPSSPPSSRNSSRPSSPVRSRSVESVIISSPGKGQNTQVSASLSSTKFGLSEMRRTVDQNNGHRTSHSPPTSGESTGKTLAQDASAKSQEIVYVPRSRKIERLTVKQLGEATPDVMHPFFTKKAGFNLEESLPQYVHEYATLPIEEIMKALVKLYSKQLD